MIETVHFKAMDQKYPIEAEVKLQWANFQGPVTEEQIVDFLTKLLFETTAKVVKKFEVQT